MFALLTLLETLALATPTLAVADLRNDTGQERLDPAGPGAASMLVTKFTKVGSLQIVERDQLAAVLDELKLSSSGLVDPAAAVKAGRMLGADYLAFGNVIGFSGDALTVHLRIVNTETAAVIVAEDVQGNLGEDGSGFFALVNELADRIVRALEIELTPEEQRSVSMVRMRELEALLRYGTGQSGEAGELADPSELCVLRPGDSVSARNPRIHGTLVSGFRRGDISREAFEDCARRVDRLQEGAARADFWERMLKVALAEVKSDSDVAVGLVDALADRSAEAVLDAGATKKAMKVLGRRESGQALRLAQVLELETGTWMGEKVTPQTFSTVADSQLVTFSHRLPDPSLRRAAATAVVDRRIAASPFQVVRDRADEARAAVLQLGYWPVPADVAISRASMPSDGTAVGTLHVKSRPRQSSARLQLDGDSETVSLEPLEAFVDGWEQALHLCTPGTVLDPTPCVAPDRLRVDDPFVQLSITNLMFRENLTVDDVVALGQRGDTLVPGLRVDDAPVEGLAFPVVLDPVPSLVYTGSTGGDGPNLEVELFAISGDRVLVGVQPAGQERVAAVVALADEKFSVASYGGSGPDGQRGVAGNPGIDGVPGAAATCEANGGNGTDGGDGGPGGPGRPGGPGGNGGNVHVVLHCDGSCAALERFAAEKIRSVAGSGGDGGAGGPGGSGGKGGPGGESGSCEVWDDFFQAYKKQTKFGGHSGSSGQMGPHGPSGQDGTPGRAGTVVVEIGR
ncbi:MAG: CsgG/HfaB family protein [Myxococcota bacterium]